jgi:hypothetical protein
MLVYPYYVFFQVGAFLVGLFCYSKVKYTHYKYFIPFLLFIACYEIGSLYDLFAIDHKNLWITNIVMTISFLFYGFFLLNIIKTPVFKKWIKGGILLSIFCTLTDVFLIQGFWNLATFAILLQLGVLIMTTCLYFYELLNYTQETLRIVRLAPFWLNTGLLFYCLLYFLFFSVFTYMAYSRSHEYWLLCDIVPNIANILLYSFLMITFLCCRKTTSPIRTMQ